MAFTAIILFVMVGFGARRVWAASSSAPAAQAALRGDLASARAIVKGILAKQSKNAEALFIGACIELQAGDLGRASELTTKLAAARGDIQEVRILRRLLEARMRGTGWLSAFIAATSAEAVDPQKNLLPYTPSARSPVDSNQLLKLTGGDGFLVRSAEADGNVSPVLVEEALRLVDQQQPLEVHLAVLSLLERPRLPENLMGTAAKSAQKLVARLATEHRNVAYV